MTGPSLSEIKNGAGYECDLHGSYFPNAFCIACNRAPVEAERDRYIRLFNRLEAAVSHHKKAHQPEGVCFADTPDEALWKARDKILKDSCEGKG